MPYILTRARQMCGAQYLVPKQALAEGSLLFLSNLRAISYCRHGIAFRAGFQLGL